MTEPAVRQWRAMGATSELLVFGPDAEALADLAVAEVERLESCWSRFRPDSELSELNRSSGRWFPTSPTLWAALGRCHHAWHATGGLFDPTVLGRLASLGYDRTFREIGRSAPATEPTPIGFGTVEFDHPSRSVRLVDGFGLDLGGIGKGLAADLITAKLRNEGAESVCLSLGGDIRVAGPGPDEDETWAIDVQHPADDRVLGAFGLTNEALVQSTTLFRRWEHEGRAVHHLIDPRTGQPSETDLVGVIITGPDAWWAEVVAKVAILLGAAAGLDFVLACGLDGWLLRQDGSILATPAVQDTFEMVRT